MLKRELIIYHESVAQELKYTKNRVRSLIGGAHWLTDGEHKESILRHVLRSRLPESVSIGSGFVCYVNDERSDSSKQIDILITSKDKPTLFRDGELVFVTADSVRAIIEIKTLLEKSQLRIACKKLADDIEKIRNESPNDDCWAGLFIYEMGNLSHKVLLEILKEVTNGCKKRAIDAVSAGDDTFVLFWENVTDRINIQTEEAVWHSYNLENLAPAYFISNLAIHLSPNVPNQSQKIWFPVDKGKETKRQFFCSLVELGVTPFEP